MAETILELRGIRKSYPGVTALDDVSLSFRRGEFTPSSARTGRGSPLS